MSSIEKVRQPACDSIDGSDLLAAPGAARDSEKGFSLLEAVIAMVVIMISLLGVFYSLSYAITFNAGNDSRAQALTVLQQQAEFLRSRKFVPTHTDTELTGGVKAQQLVTALNGNQFTVDISIDNDPSDPDIDDEAAVPNTAIKEIVIRVQVAAPNPGWQTAVPVELIMRRVRGN